MKFDYVIVCAGSAGCALALRLSEDADRSVLLLESGPDYSDPNLMPSELKYLGNGSASIAGALHNWSYHAQGSERQKSQPLARGRVTGGTSAINHSIFLRGAPDDFNRWAESGNDRWSYEEVLPYFRKIESDKDFSNEFHGERGPIPVRRHPPHTWEPYQKAFFEAAIVAGFPADPDLNHPQSTGVGAVPLNDSDGMRISTALSHLDAGRHHPNLRISPNSHVRRILFRNKKAYAVEAESKGEIVIHTGSEIIISAGTIISPQLLMLSGVGPVVHLEKFGIVPIHSLPGVGQAMKNHPVVQVRFEPKADFVISADAPRNQVLLRFTATGSSMRNDIQIQPLNPYAESIESAGVTMGARLEHPLSTGIIRLASSDPNMQPIIENRLLSHPRDRQRMREAVRLCCALLKQPSLNSLIEKRVAPDDNVLASDDALDLWMHQTVRMAGHMVSSCKMGPASDAMSVVDQFCSVHGLEGLRVVDASIMPDIPRANTNATTIMIGERAADLIRDSYG